MRKTEMIDGLVELLIQLVHKISVRAERKVENELSSEFRRVQGKHGTLARLAQAALDLPEELVRTAIYPVVGTATLADIIAEAKANEKELRTRVRVRLRGSYSRHYRRGLPKLLRALGFRCNNTTFQPVMDALALLERYADSEAVFYDAAETMPIEHVVPEDWQEAVADEHGRIERIPYELCALVALRKALRRREIWVEGGKTWRNPEADLPADFDDNRDVHYEALAKPRDPAAFIADLQRRHTAALNRLESALRKGTTGGVAITRRKGEPWISVPPLDKQEEPTGLKALKAEISRRWGVIDLLDVLKDVAHVTGYPAAFTSVASRTVTEEAVLQRRLLLCLYGLGTNVGIKRVAAAALPVGQADTEAALRRTPPAVHQPRQPARREPPDRQCHADGARCGPVGRGHLVRVRLAQVRLVGGQRDDRVASALRRAWDHGVLARRTTVGVHLQPGHEHDRFGSGLDDRGPAAASDRRRHRSPVHRCARRFHRGGRLLRAAGLQAAAPVEEHRLGAAVPARDR
ncbi:hypothetical protein GCM10009850_037480 [Nonomuraea monospora]|uniref:Tn3 transposase DDE domain-containing protein n=1 Tax=Nonomuraea monospora TaxID=568818 RepID=A0ABN3CFW8_9ACTN